MAEYQLKTDGAMGNERRSHRGQLFRAECFEEPCRICGDNTVGDTVSLVRSGLSYPIPPYRKLGEHAAYPDDVRVITLCQDCLHWMLEQAR